MKYSFSSLLLPSIILRMILASKHGLTFILILTSIFCHAQVPLTDFEGTLSVYLPEDTTSLHIGRNVGFNTSGSNKYNTVVGSEAGGSYDGFDYSSFYGYRAGYYAGNDDNSFFGAFAGENTGIGFSQGTGNSFFGTDSGRLNNEGDENCFFGNECGYSNTSGGSNSYFGTWAGYSNNGDYNSYFGYEAGEDGTAGNYNSFFGSNSGQRTNGNYNNFFGHQAGYSNKTGESNVAIGAYASYLSGSTDNHGSFNAAVGDSSMYFLDTHAEIPGERNAALGAGSLFAKIDKGSNRSVAVGYHAGYDGGSRSVFIGNEAGEGASQRNDVLYIDTRKGDDPLIYGEFNNDYVKINGTGDYSDVLRVGTNASPPSYPITGEGMELVYDTATNLGQIQVYDRDNKSWGRLHLGNGNVGIGTNNPTQTLDVDGGVRFRNIGTQNAQISTLYRAFQTGEIVTSSSDLRLKENIEPMNNALNKVIKMSAFHYEYISDPNNFRDVGLMAQDLEKIAPELVFTNQESGYKGIIYEKLTPYLIEAIKEQQTIIDDLKSQLELHTSESEKQQSQLESRDRQFASLLSRIEQLENGNSSNED